MSKIENICKAIAALPNVKADANVFMVDDFSGQIQGSWADKRIVYTRIFKELKDAEILPQKSILQTDFWTFVEDWIKELHKQNPRSFLKMAKSFPSVKRRRSSKLI